MKAAVRYQFVELASAAFAPGERFVRKFLKRLGETAAIDTFILIYGHFYLSLIADDRSFLSRGCKTQPI